MIRPRSKLRRGEPTKEEKQAARKECSARATRRCEDCGRRTTLANGHLHHMHGKQRFGWQESEIQTHRWLCPACHHARHNPKAVPAKERT